MFITYGEVEEEYFYNTAGCGPKAETKSHPTKGMIEFCG